jgi:hypothetical protein
MGQLQVFISFPEGSVAVKRNRSASGNTGPKSISSATVSPGRADELRAKYHFP